MPDYNMFETREMIEAVNEMKPIGGFFQTVFFRGREKLHTALKIDIDVVKGTRRVPAYSQVQAKSIPFERDAMSTSSFQPPCLKPSRVVTPADTMLRMAGESIYSIRSPQERAAEMLRTDLQDMIDGISRAEEKQAAEAIVNGVILIQGDDTDATVDMQRDSSLLNLAAIALPSGGWTVSASLENDFRFIQNQVFQKSGMTPNVAVMNYVSMGKFLANTGVKSYLDNRRIQIGGLALQAKMDFSQGIYRGDYMGVDLWEYNDGTENISGNFVPFIPDNKVVMGSTQARCVFHYGAIQDLDFLSGTIAQLKLFSKSWIEKDPSARKALVQSHPVAVTENTDAFASFFVA